MKRRREEVVLRKGVLKLGQSIYIFFIEGWAWLKV